MRSVDPGATLVSLPAFLLNELNDKTFGYLIAYVLPGFALLLQLGELSPAVRGWILASSVSQTLEDDALYAQVRDLKDENNTGTSPETFRRLVARFGRDAMQKHVAVVLAQREHRPGSIQKSELAAYINRLQHDHPEPDWYADLRRAERLARFDEITPSQLSLNLYGTFFRE